MAKEQFALAKDHAYSMDTRFVKNDEKAAIHEPCFHATI
nr:MAG TPA_asm: hypothetical protein [Bacteriophage sp.]